MTSYADTWKLTQPLGRGLSAVAGLVVERIRQFGLAIKNRRDAAALASLDDRMLVDIGLSRSDLREAFSEPPWRDPSALLVRRVQQRRRRIPLRAAMVTAPATVTEQVRDAVLSRMP